jgi:predicted adenine nucleotide alpha hydrolase (AANH) superfamily ATPase
MNRKRIALMSCCTPCSVAAIKALAAGGADIRVLFFNPNIFPRAEYDRRLAEQVRLCGKYGAEIIAGEYDHDAWLQAIEGSERGPERGARCAACFRHRFALGAEWAAAHGCGEIASVFGVSRHKDKAQVDAAARASLGPRPDSASPAYIDTDFGYAPEAGAYRQKYCGCEFSEGYCGKD